MIDDDDDEYEVTDEDIEEYEADEADWAMRLDYGEDDDEEDDYEDTN